MVCSLCPRVCGRAERHQGEGRKELGDGSKVPVVSRDCCRTSETDLEQRGDIPILVAHLIPAKGVEFPSCEKVVKMIVQDLHNLGYHRVVSRSDNEPSILSLLRAVKLAWTGDVVQETSAEGDPQSNGAAESSPNVAKRACQIDQTGRGVSFEVEVPADHDLLMWLVPCPASMHRRFAVGRDSKTAYERNVEGALFLPCCSSVSECGGCLCSQPTTVWAFWTPDLDRTRYLLARPVEW